MVEFDAFEFRIDVNESTPGSKVEVSESLEALDDAVQTLNRELTTLTQHDGIEVEIHIGVSPLDVSSENSRDN